MSRNKADGHLFKPEYSVCVCVVWWLAQRAGSVSDLLYSQRVQTGEVSEGSVSDEADLVVTNWELLELTQAYEAALLQAHQLIRAEVTNIHRNRTNQMASHLSRHILDMLHVPGYVLILETHHTHMTWWAVRSRGLRWMSFYKGHNRNLKEDVIYNTVLYYSMIWFVRVVLQEQVFRNRNSL